MPYEEIVRNLRKKFPRTASTGIHKTRLASGTVRFADLLLKIDGTCSRGHDTPAKTIATTPDIYIISFKEKKKKKKKKKRKEKIPCTKTHVIKGLCYQN